MFESMMSLIEKNENFYFKDFTHSDGLTYRIFNYRHVFFEDFHKYENAKWARGITFILNENGTAELSCLCMAKFFNLNEGGAVHNFNDVDCITDKLDGSLVSTFINGNGNLDVKSKSSFISDHCHMARDIIANDKELHDILFRMTNNGLTVDMELTSKSLKIVLNYNEDKLTIISAQDKASKKSLNYAELKNAVGNDKYLVKNYLNDIEDITDFIKSVAEKQNIEGFVITKANGERVKLKTIEYLSVHKMLDKINSKKGRFWLVMDEKDDDLLSIMDSVVIIKSMENTAKEKAEILSGFSAFKKTVYGFYDENKDLIVKDYAMKAKKTFNGQNKVLFSTVMGLYKGYNIDMKMAFSKLYFND